MRGTRGWECTGLGRGQGLGGIPGRGAMEQEAGWSMLAHSGGPREEAEASLGIAKTWSGGEMEGWKGDRLHSQSLGEEDKLLCRVTFAGQVPFPSTNAQPSRAPQCTPIA